jgi:hypothetical protein
VSIEQIRKAARVAADLSRRFVKTPQQTVVLNKLLLLYEERNRAIETNTFSQTDGLALVAPTGAGKSRTLKWVFSELERIAASPGSNGSVNILSVRVRTPANLRTAAEAVMGQIGYPVPIRNLTEATVPGLWEKVHFQLKAQKVCILHLDEAQDIWGNANKPQRVAANNTLKSLTQNAVWPAIVILSGTEELKEMLNQDQQLARRIKPTEILPIAKATDAKTVRAVITSFTSEAGLVSFKEADTKFLDRFFVACCNRLGIAIRLVIGAIKQAILADDPGLMDQHFALAYADIPECDAQMNPFLSDDWSTIDASKVFARCNNEPDDHSKSQKSPRLRSGQ